MKTEITTADLAELSRDKARLDWLADPKNAIGSVSLPERHVLANLHSMRAAIDSAMTEDAATESD